jgi:hypothetical protein
MDAAHRNFQLGTSGYALKRKKEMNEQLSNNDIMSADGRVGSLGQSWRYWESASIVGHLQIASNA